MTWNGFYFICKHLNEPTVLMWLTDSKLSSGKFCTCLQ
jgi:hypothetical protein